MKILIATMTCGECHNAIARGLTEKFSERVEVKLVNIYAHLRKSDKVEKEYFFFVKHMPRLFTFAWNIGRKTNPMKRYRGLAMSGVKCALEEMAKVVEEFQPDAVVCTHNHVSNLFCYLKIHNRYRGKIYSFLCDYIVCPNWEGSVLCDAVFTPHEITHPELLSRGFREEQLHPFGFPVHPKYDIPVSRSEARAALSLSEDDFVVLSMNGGAGIGDNTKIIKQVVKANKGGKRLKMFVICGRNERDFRRNAKLVNRKKYDGVEILGFVKNLELYYAAADILFCRGGCGVFSEAMKMNVPYIVVREHVVAQELANGRLMQSLGRGCVMKRLSDAKKIVEKYAKLSGIPKDGNQSVGYVTDRSIEKVVEFVRENALLS